MDCDRIEGNLYFNSNNKSKIAKLMYVPNFFPALPIRLSVHSIVRVCFFFFFLLPCISLQ